MEEEMEIQTVRLLKLGIPRIVSALVGKRSNRTEDKNPASVCPNRDQSLILLLLHLLYELSFSFCTRTFYKNWKSGFVPHVTVLVQKLNNNSDSKCERKYPKKTRFKKSTVFKWISHSWNSEQDICNFPKFSFQSSLQHYGSGNHKIVSHRPGWRDFGSGTKRE